MLITYWVLMFVSTGKTLKVWWLDSRHDVLVIVSLLLTLFCGCCTLLDNMFWKHSIHWLLFCAFISIFSPMSQSQSAMSESQDNVHGQLLHSLLMRLNVCEQLTYLMHSAMSVVFLFICSFIAQNITFTSIAVLLRAHDVVLIYVNKE